jgi:hypothetical protein
LGVLIGALVNNKHNSSPQSLTIPSDFHWVSRFNNFCAFFVTKTQAGRNSISYLGFYHFICPIFRCSIALDCQPSKIL